MGRPGALHRLDTQRLNELRRTTRFIPGVYGLPAERCSIRLVLVSRLRWRRRLTWRNPRLAVVTAPGLLIGAIPLMSAAVASTLWHEIGQRDGQTPTQPCPQSIPATAHADHDMRARASHVAF
jgi:hypothetical protein